MSEYIRALVIPHGCDRDADGTQVGDDWLLADLGRATDDAEVYITSDHLHASELGDLGLDDPRECAALMVGATNFWLGGASAIAARVKGAFVATVVLQFLVALYHERLP